MTTRLLPVASALLALTLPAAAQLSVWNVDASGGGDFTTLQAAIDAAGAGDLVLIQGGGVTESVVVDKGLHIVGDGGFGVLKPIGSTEPVLRVVGLPAGETVVLSGLTVFVGDAGAAAALHVEDCAGSVWLQDLFVDSYGAQALLAQDADTVVLTNTFLQTNLVPALPDGTPQDAPGARAEGSRVFAHDSRLVGSHGTLQGAGNPTPSDAPDGGDGIHLEDSSAVLRSCELSGGSGNALLVDGCQHGGDGGTGAVLRTTGAGPQVASLSMTGAGSQIAGASGGTFDAGCAEPPQPGQAVDAGPGTSFDVSGSGPLRSFHAPDLVAPGETLTLSFTGAPGDTALLLAANGGAPALPIGLGGHLYLDLGSLLVLAALPLGAGALDVPVTMPALPVGAAGAVLPLQVVFLGTDAFKSTSQPRLLAVR